jgi:uncharacterized membrane protein YhaH (DUF805 family)
MEFKDIFNFEEIKTELIFGLKNSFNFTGTTSRKSFFQFSIGFISSWLVIRFLIDLSNIMIFKAAFSLFTLVLFIPTLAIITRRFKDREKKVIGYIIFFFIGIAGAIAFSIIGNQLERELSFVLERLILGILMLSTVGALYVCVR